MAMTNIYAGISSVARSVIRIHVGVNNVSRPVYRVFVGVNNKARLVTIGFTFIGRLSIPRYQTASAAVGNYVLFAGGMTHNDVGNITRVDAFTSTLSRTTASLSYSNNWAKGLELGNYALFPMSNIQDYTSDTYDTRSKIIDGFNNNLSKVSVPPRTYGGVHYGVANTSSYGLVIGGYLQTTNQIHKSVDAYNASLTKTSATSYPVFGRYFNGTRAGNSAVFAGGLTNPEITNIVVSYNNSLTQSTLANLPIYTYSIVEAGASNSSYGIIAGGIYQDTSTSTQYKSNRGFAWNSSLTRSTANLPGNGTLGAIAMSSSNLAVYADPTFNGAILYNTSLTYKVYQRSIHHGLFGSGAFLKNTNSMIYSIGRLGNESTLSNTASDIVCKI